MAHDPPRTMFLRIQTRPDELEPGLVNETRALILPVFVASAILFGAIFVLVDDHRQQAPLTTNDVAEAH
jgi:hypothetical protein